MYNNFSINPSLLNLPVLELQFQDVTGFFVDKIDDLICLNFGDKDIDLCKWVNRDEIESNYIL